jgi:hypothetical protein
MGALCPYISIGSSTGSGFYYTTEAASYLVTAKHVLFERGLELYHSTATLSSIDLKLIPLEMVVDCAALQNSDDLKKHQKADVAVMKIGNIVQEQKRICAFLPALKVNAPQPGGALVGCPRRTSDDSRKLVFPIAPFCSLIQASR